MVALTIFHGVPAGEGIAITLKTALGQSNLSADFATDRLGRTGCTLGVGVEGHGDIIRPYTLGRSVFVAVNILDLNVGECAVLCSANILHLIDVVIVSAIRQRQARSHIECVIRTTTACNEGAVEDRTIFDHNFAGAVCLYDTAEGRTIVDGQFAVDEQVAALIPLALGIGGLAPLIIRREVIEHQERAAICHYGRSALIHRNGRTGQNRRLGGNGEASTLLHQVHVIRNAKGNLIGREAHAQVQREWQEADIAVCSEDRFPDRDTIGIRYLIGVIADSERCIFIQEEHSLLVLGELSHSECRCANLRVHHIDHGIALQCAIIIDHQVALDIEQRKAVEWGAAIAYPPKKC